MTKLTRNRMPWRVLAHPRRTNKFVDCSIEDVGESLGEEFDEIVLGDWLHVEQMDVDHYWLRLGEKTYNVVIDPRTGNAKSVRRQV